MHHNGTARRRAQRSTRLSLSMDASNHGRQVDLQGVPILLVGGDTTSATRLLDALGDHGCHVRVAASAEDALEMLEAFRPRVLVLELVLPSMSGLLLAQRLKAELAGRDIVIIAVTSFSGSEVQRLALNAGCAACVARPVDAETFATLVAHHISATRSEGGA